MNCKYCLVIIWMVSCLNLWSDEPLSLSLNQAEDLAVQNNYSLNASLHRLEQGYYGYRASKDYFLPNLTFTGSANVTREQHQHSIDAALRLTQPIYDKVACYNLKEAQIQWEQLRLDVQQQVCEILFQVREAYHEIIFHQAHLAIDQMILQIWQDELKRQERQLELGASIPYEVNQTQLHLKNAWIDFYATQKEIRKSQIKLLTVLGLPPDTSFNITEKEIPLPELNCHKTNAEQWKNWTLQYRPELKKEQFAFLLSQNKVKQIQAETSPTVSVYANAGHRYINNGFDGQPSVGVGVNLDWMLYDPSNKQKIRQAQEGRREAASNYYQMELEATADTYHLLNEIEQYYHSYFTAREGAALAEEGMKLATKKQQLGLMSAFEFRDAIKVLHEAQQKVNQAKFDLRNAYDKLVLQAGVDLAQSE